jgi:Leucine-rich repeat (LRR) protein
VYSNRLNGTLPSEIGYLTNLELLDLESNSLSGQLFIPELFNIAGTIRRLRGSDNHFEGTIPQNITNFSNLRELWVADNMFNGTIPEGITTLTNLGEKSFHCDFFGF